jgi:hypothetical protein
MENSFSFLLIHHFIVHLTQVGVLGMKKCKHWKVHGHMYTHNISKMTCVTAYLHTFSYTSIWIVKWMQILKSTECICSERAKQIFLNTSGYNMDSLAKRSKPHRHFIPTGKEHTECGLWCTNCQDKSISPLIILPLSKPSFPYHYCCPHSPP